MTGRKHPSELFSSKLQLTKGQIFRKAEFVLDYMKYKINETSLETCVYFRKNGIPFTSEDFKKRLMKRDLVDVKYKELTAEYRALQFYHDEAQNEVIRTNESRKRHILGGLLIPDQTAALDALNWYLNHLDPKFVKSIPENYDLIIKRPIQQVADYVAELSKDKLEELEKSIDHTFMSQIESNPITIDLPRDYFEKYPERMNICGINVAQYDFNAEYYNQ